MDSDYKRPIIAAVVILIIMASIMIIVIRINAPDRTTKEGTLEIGPWQTDYINISIGPGRYEIYYEFTSKNDVPFNYAVRNESGFWFDYLDNDVKHTTGSPYPGRGNYTFIFKNNTDKLLKLDYLIHYVEGIYE